MAESLRDQVLAWSRPSVPWDRHISSYCPKVVEALKDLLSERIQNLFLEFRDHAILFSYASDCTIVRTMVTYTKSGSAIQPLVDGSLKMAVHLADALPMALGKKAWNHFVAANDFAPVLPARAPGKGIRISHYCFDRAIYSSTATKLMQRHVLWHDAENADDPQQYLTWLLDWHLSTPCVLHDTHNALKWSLMAVSDAERGFSSLNAVLNGLRGSFNHLHDAIVPYLQTHLIPVDRQNNEEEDERLMLILDAVEECIAEECVWQATLSWAFWSRLAHLPLSKSNAHVLMGNVIHASYVASAYMSQKFLNVANAPPWSMCIKPKDAVAKLSQMAEEPSGFLECKIFKLLRLGSYVLNAPDCQNPSPPFFRFLVDLKFCSALPNPADNKKSLC